jgi:predicted lipid-binding transport protein (Tim44 family)
MALLAPHFSENAQKSLLSRQPAGTQIERVVIGSMAVSQLTLPDRATTDDGQPYYVKVSVRFESNMSCLVDGKQQKFYVDETWTLARAADARSETQEWMEARRCANCGAPFENSSSRVCESCGAVFADARFGWLVTGVVLNEQKNRPSSLTGYAPEVGTNDATRIHPRTRQELDALAADDPAFTEEGLILRAKLIFEELYQAWNDDELARARPYISDSLYNYLSYWLDAYRHEGLENWVEDYRLTHFDVAKVVRDKHYDAVTVRLWASGKDYTVNAKRKVVGGSKRKERHYSEYWTLIRRAEARGKASVDKQCPNCGAQQKISRAGICEYCKAHITSGEFDWILSKIEQDEAYRG